MFNNRLQIEAAIAACVAAVGLAFGAPHASAQSCHCSSGDHCSGGSNPPAQPPQRSANEDRRPAGPLNRAGYATQAPHGGQVTATQWHQFEVVYLPRETRIYIYSPSRRPISALGVRGEVVMQVHSNPQRFRYPVQPAGAAGLSGEPAYLVAVVDVSRVRDGDMEVTFDLDNLPMPEEKHVRFTQTFARTRPPLQVTVAPVTEADRPLIQRQRWCPVMGDELADSGDVIKLMVGNQPLFVCCEECIAKVEKSPQFYLRKAAMALAPARQTPPRRMPPPRRPQVSVSYAARADEPAIRAQRTCPVTGQPLGQHGTPIKLLINGRALFVCCKGCVGKVEKDPDYYLRKVAALGGR